MLYFSMMIELENDKHILSASRLATPVVDVENLNQLTTPLTLPFLVEETPLPMVEETESEEESSTQKFDGVEMTHDDDLNAGDDILNPSDGDGHDQDMEVHDTPVKEELLGHGHIHKIKPTRIEDLLQIRYMRHLIIRLNTSFPCARFSENHRCYLAAIANQEIPQHYSQAVEDPDF